MIFFLIIIIIISYELSFGFCMVWQRRKEYASMFFSRNMLIASAIQILHATERDINFGRWRTLQCCKSAMQDLWLMIPKEQDAPCMGNRPQADRSCRFGIYIYIYDLSKRVLNYKTKYALINEQQFSWVRLG
jgi:hypothetical protein